MRRAIALLGLGGATVVVLAATLWGLDPARAAEALRTARLGGLPVLLAAFAVNHLIRILRWHVLLDAAPLRRSAFAASIGFLATMVLPLRLGEVVRPLAHRRDGVPLARSFAAVLVERTLDLVALLVLLGWVALVPDLPPVVIEGLDVVGAGRRAAAVGTVVSGVAVLGAVLLGDRLGAVPIVGRFLADLGRAARELASSPRRAALGVALTAASWASVVVYFAVGMRCFPALPTGLEVATVTWASVIAAATVLPTPGFLGSYEAGAVGALALFGADLDVARTFALAIHLAYFLFVAVIGIVALLAQGEPLRALTRNTP